MSRVRVRYYLEDYAHRLFVTTLVHRVAAEIGLKDEDLEDDVANASGGRGTVMTGLKQFLRDCRRQVAQTPDLVVVAVDANCSGSRKLRKTITDKVKPEEYPFPIVLAVPEPHIERWYLLDPQALRAAVPGAVTPSLPEGKCGQDFYVRLLRDVFLKVGRRPPLGGVEVGDRIAAVMDLQQSEKSFADFVRDLGAAFRRVV